MIAGGQDFQEDMKEVRGRVVPSVEGRWHAGHLEEQLPQGKPVGRGTYKG